MYYTFRQFVENYEFAYSQNNYNSWAIRHLAYVETC